ncbi:hypothetical protein MMC27_006601 [Xylographa pallens]|nr:hypothetical protein [Xylographa pallens]
MTDCSDRTESSGMSGKMEKGQLSDGEAIRQLASTNIKPLSNQSCTSAEEEMIRDTSPDGVNAAHLLAWYKSAQLFEEMVEHILPVLENTGSTDPSHFLLGLAIERSAIGAPVCFSWKDANIVEREEAKGSFVSMATSSSLPSSSRGSLIEEENAEMEHAQCDRDGK